MADPDLTTANLAALFQMLVPFAYALLRVAVGLALVPHGLRNTFGFFPNTGMRALNLAALARQLDEGGYRPGSFWAPAISVTQLVGGPLLALGLFTRPIAAVVLVFLFVANVERWRIGSYFWNQLGLEYTLMWTSPHSTFWFTAAAAIRSTTCSAGTIESDAVRRPQSKSERGMAALRSFIRLRESARQAEPLRRLLHSL